MSWQDLPADLRRLIEAEAGAFVGAEQLGTGHNCLLGMVMHTTHDRYFLKGVPSDHKRAVWTQSNEAAINPHIRHVSAPLVFHVAAVGWDVLGFRSLDAQHADMSPGSPDLPKITASLQALASIPAPDRLTLRTAEDRWRNYAGDHAHLLAGTTVAHTDLHRHNILIEGTAKFIDWAWPTLAAPWFDTASVGLQLIRAGHTPKDAELWCQNFPAFAEATNQAVTTFVTAARGLWAEIATTDPQPWKVEVADAADVWAGYRDLR
ncbi:phosphotransferase [Catellatospora methionotrophica]|uniref:phosphotransferase n=1 Tax=Catellatospora methionotrophica TaxID=121620 RepID=UPI00340CAD37